MGDMPATLQWSDSLKSRSRQNHDSNAKVWRQNQGNPLVVTATLRYYRTRRISGAAWKRLFLPPIRSSRWSRGDDLLKWGNVLRIGRMKCSGHLTFIERKSILCFSRQYIFLDRNRDPFASVCLSQPVLYCFMQRRFMKTTPNNESRSW